MAKKKTKLDKMSKKERTSLAYALATNLAKHGKPQTPKNERKLTKGEMKKKEKNVMKFKKAFDLEEIQTIMQTILDKRPKPKPSPKEDGLPKNYNPRTGMFTEQNCGCGKNPCETYGNIQEKKLDPVGKEDADINNDGKVDKTDDYLKNRREKVSKAIKKEDLDVGHQDDEPRMLKADLYRIAKYASELYQMVDKFDDMEQEVDFPSWWQAKITTAKDYLVKAKHYLDGQLKVDQIDAMLGEDKDEHKVLSPKELDRLAALPPTDPSFKKDRRHKKLMKKLNAKV